MWPFRRSSKPAAVSTQEELSDGEYTEEEYEEEVEYEVEVTDSEGESDEEEDQTDDDGVIVEACDAAIPSEEVPEIEPEAENSPEQELQEENTEVPDEPEEEEKTTQDSKESAAEDESGMAEPKVEKAEEIQDAPESKAEVEENHLESRNEEETENEKERSEDESDDSSGEDESEEEEEEDAEEEEEETATSLEEKHSLLALAAEHDRVDILQSILSNEEDKELLLNHEQPPLHIAISFGSTNATNCLLRLGANPALRPNTDTNKKLQGRTAWELAFGSNEEGDKGGDAGWFSPSKSKKIKPVDMLPSKREGIRHAFSAEALRSIGADEAARLQQLLESGMPQDTDLGGDKDIAGWCVEMGATQCLALVSKKAIEVTNDEPEKLATTAADGTQMKSGVETVDEANDSRPEEPSGCDLAEASPAPLVHRLSSNADDAESLKNRIEELDTLAGGLSTYLDNLAEEVSVCHGLLLMGNGASALASHVRSLKDQQDFLRTDLEDRTAQWADTEDELSHYLKRHNIKDDKELLPTSLNQTSLSRRISTNDPMQLRAQLGASENKIRKLRASIADMSEESDAAMKEVERRGLTGGIKLVRKLREEIRELEFELSEAKSGEALCRTKLQQARKLHDDATKQSKNAVPKLGQPKAPTAPPSDAAPLEIAKSDHASLTEDPPSVSRDVLAPSSLELEQEQSTTLTSSTPALSNGNSQKVSSGQSNALMKYQKEGKGYMPTELWRILLRIIGLGRVAVKQQVNDLKKQSSSVMIV